MKRERPVKKRADKPTIMRRKRKRQRMKPIRQAIKRALAVTVRHIEERTQ